jgi:hypothetical protein
MDRSKEQLYSITWSARTMSVGGISSPSVAS